MVTIVLDEFGFKNKLDFVDGIILAPTRTNYIYLILERANTMVVMTFVISFSFHSLNCHMERHYFKHIV